MSRAAIQQVRPSNSIAEQCISRLDLDRELDVAPGYHVKKNSRTYHAFTYRDIIGNPCKRIELANLYGVTGHTISAVYERNNGNFLLANIDLLRRLKVKK